MAITKIFCILILCLTSGYGLCYQPEPILLGVSNATSGPASQLGIKLNLGAHAFVERINLAGGIKGQQIELVQLDDSYEPYLTKKNTTILIDKHNVFALFNYVGTPTSHAIYDQVVKDELVYFTPFTGAQFLREPQKQNIINLRASYREEVESHVKFLVEVKKFTKIGVLVQSDHFGLAVEQEYIRALNAYGLEPTINTHFRRNTLDIDWALNKLIQSDVQAVGFAGTYQPLAALVNTATAKNFTPYFTTVSFVSSQDLFLRIKPTPKVLVSEVMPNPKDCSWLICEQFKSDMALINVKDYGRIEFEGYVNTYLFSQFVSQCDVPLTKSCFLEQARNWQTTPTNPHQHLSLFYDIQHYEVKLFHQKE